MSACRRKNRWEGGRQRARRARLAAEATCLQVRRASQPRAVMRPHGRDRSNVRDERRYEIKRGAGSVHPACARGLREEATRDACPASRRPLEARRPGLRIVDELEHRPAVFGDVRVVRARAVGQRVAEGRLVVEVALQRLVQPGASFP